MERVDIEQITAQLADCKNAAEEKVVFDNFLAEKAAERARVADELIAGHFAKVTLALGKKLPGIGGKYIVDLSDGSAVKLVATPRNANGNKGSRAITVTKEGNLIGSYANGTLACQALNLDCTGNSGPRVLRDNGYTVTPQVE